MLIFRVDANDLISGGHVRRCLSIADFWRERGGKCLFVSADRGVIPFIEPSGFEYEILETDWRDMSTEVPAMCRLLDTCENPVLLIDTYQVDSAYVDEVSKYAKIGYLGTKRLLAPKLDFLVNYSINIDSAFYSRAYDDTRVLLGPAFAPLGSAFRAPRREFSNVVHSVLITTGNADGEGMTNLIIEALDTTLSEVGAKMFVIVGPLNRAGASLRMRYEQNPFIKIIENVSNIACYMHESDIAVSACGTTLYELAACGVPTVGFSLSAEQDANGETEELKKRGVIAYAGCAYEEKNACIKVIKQEVSMLTSDNEYRAKLADRFHALVDGSGCERICDEIQRIEVVQ